MLISKIKIKGDNLVLKLDGEFDQHYADKLRISISELLFKYNLKYLLIDMENLGFMDSSAIGFIIGRYNYLRKINGRIILYNLNTKIEKIIMLSGIYKICDIEKNRYHFEEIGA